MPGRPLFTSPGGIPRLTHQAGGTGRITHQANITARQCFRLERFRLDVCAGYGVKGVLQKRRRLIQLILANAPGGGNECE
jgi:hypothetical protein